MTQQFFLHYTLKGLQFKVCRVGVQHSITFPFPDIQCIDTYISLNKAVFLQTAT